MDPEEKVHAPPPAKQAKAADLHHHADVVHQRQASEHEEQLRRLKEEEHHAFFEFLSRPFTDEDFAELRERTGEAVHEGMYEVEITRFPAAYLPDHGRAINNDDEDWPKSLIGYAARIYDVYRKYGEPNGYKLIARVLDYPHNMIGTIGLYLHW